MRLVLLLPGILLPLLLASAPANAIKKVPYPEIAVRGLPVFKGDPGLDELRKRLTAAVAAKDANAAAALAAPSFEWTAGGVPVDEFDPKRDAVHNFKVAFGFRPAGKDADGPTEVGPQWELLNYFATDETLTQEANSTLVCGSTAARVTDEAALEDALQRIDEPDDLSEWVYSLGEIALTAAPDGGAPVAKVKSVAMPIVAVHPAPSGDAAPAPTHFELLLPSGKSGWTPIQGLRPLFIDRMCFAKVGNEWKIAVYDQAE
ncbi:MAG: hypothetical protein IT539_03090 [Bradyrhizobiaceae bacterium]|nr:hypothetical protein [Bradyrhizobiaceae bacterium]